MNDKALSDFLPKNNTSYYNRLNNTNTDIKINKKEVIQELKKVMDPEIPVNLYDLGLIYDINLDSENNVIINMTLTNPNCPVAGSMPKSVGMAIEKIQNISSVKVNLVWEPKWNKSMMSEDAKLALDIF